MGFYQESPRRRGRFWELEWIGALPGKRENVRYLGDYTLRQQDIDTLGQFDDIVAYGGWTMDDHPPAAFHHIGEPTEHHEAPSPYGIPYRCLYSSHISNLFFAGRNISATHMALSSSRVMATCSMLGQAVGTAAAMAVQKNLGSRAIGEQCITELQNRLLDNDQWLPGHVRAQPAIMRQAEVAGEGVLGDLKALFDGHERRLKYENHWVEVEAEGYLELTWPEPVSLERVRMVVHSNLHDGKCMPCTYPKKGWNEQMPAKMPKTLSILVRVNGQWQEVQKVSNNRQRQIRLTIEGCYDGLRVLVKDTWGGQAAGVFALEVGQPDYSAPLQRVDWPEIVMTGSHSAA